jgi:NAD(P)-dependent dehydrogenase (short-subunit alcohol dehydrogenase family)
LVISVVGDVADPAWTARVVAHLPDGLDFLVLNAAAPIHPFDLTPQTARDLGRYVGGALDVVSCPLAGLLEPLAVSRGRCLLVSSAALASPPVDWPHYVSAKAAAEGLLSWYAASHPEVGFQAVRPGTLRTGQTNTPAIRELAAPVEPAAAEIVRLLLADRPSAGGLSVTAVG